jgi:ribosomal protein S18 acetylase RimI-like enzyme
MPEIEIRPAIETDIPHLTGFDHSYRSDYVWQMNPQFEAGQLGAIFREVRLPRQVQVDYPRSPQLLAGNWKERSGNLVALLKGAPVGYASLIRGRLPFTAWMSDLVVDPSHRRQGIGTALVLASLDWVAARLDDHRLVLEMQPKNFPAICLAQKLGFDFCGYIDHYYTNRDIAILFTKWII